MSDQPHQIKVTIRPDGKITSEVIGVEGPACTTLSAWLDELGKIEEDRHTPDYRKQPKQGVVIKR